jgi:hypothetical protein
MLRPSVLDFITLIFGEEYKLWSTSFPQHIVLIKIYNFYLKSSFLLHLGLYLATYKNKIISRCSLMSLLFFIFLKRKKKQFITATIISLLLIRSVDDARRPLSGIDRIASEGHKIARNPLWNYVYPKRIIHLFTFWPPLKQDLALLKYN